MTSWAEATKVAVQAAGAYRDEVVTLSGAEAAHAHVHLVAHMQVLAAQDQVAYWRQSGFAWHALGLLMGRVVADPPVRADAGGRDCARAHSDRGVLRSRVPWRDWRDRGVGFVKSQGNTTAGGSNDRSRPLPHVGEGRRSSHHVHESRPKPAGLDWDALMPACTTCGARSGRVNSESGLCPSCAAPAASTPVAVAPVGELDTAARDDDLDDVEDLEDLDDSPDPALSAAGRSGGRGDRQQLVAVLVDELHPDPDNPREDTDDVADLAASMVSVGLLQPIIARRVVDGDGARLVVVAGHRRLAAAKRLRWARVATVIRRDMAPDEVLAAMLIENGQRRDLDPIEEARALRRLGSDYNAGSHQQIAALVGKTQPYVSGRMALLDLPVEDQDAIRAGEMNVGDGIRRGRVAAGRVRPKGVTGSPHLGVEHDLARRAKARCQQLGHNRAGRNSVGGVACGACWESVIRADERTHLHDVSNQRGRCVLCDATSGGGS